MHIYQYTITIGDEPEKDEHYFIIARSEKRASELLHIFWAADLGDTYWVGSNWFNHEALDPQEVLSIFKTNKESLIYWSQKWGWRQYPRELYEDADQPNAGS